VTPREEATMPTTKQRLPRRHAPSLQRFVLEELASFTKEGAFASNAPGKAEPEWASVLLFAPTAVVWFLDATRCAC
jgi:hypothetical protein